jgi:Acetyltransferase (isoleucine patch superfamily)
MRDSGRNQFKKFRGIISILVFLTGIFGRRVNYFFLKIFRNMNGKIGLLLRYILLKNCCAKVGDNVSIQPGVYLFNLQNVEFGNNVSVHPMCYIDGAANIRIGNNVSIAHSCSILTANHQWDDISLPIKYNKEVLLPVIIEEDVWLGCGVRVLAGVKIHRRSIIAAGAVVNKDIESSTIYGGVPAKKIKSI